MNAISSFLSVGSINPIFYRFSGLFTNSVNSSFIYAFFLIIFIYYKKLIPKFFAKRLFIITYLVAYLYCFSRASIIFLFFCILIKEPTRTKRNLVNLSLKEFISSIVILYFKLHQFLVSFSMKGLTVNSGCSNISNYHPTFF